MTAVAPGVSVVIPTVGRAELVRSIASVRAQDYLGEVEVIVVGDLPQGSLDPSVCSQADVVLYTGGGKRGGAARNLGMGAASKEFVGFLDDDDEWFPWKLSSQIPAFEALQVDVTGTRSVYRNAVTSTTSSPVPEVPMAAGARVSDYLFHARKPRAGRAVIYTSTLVARSEIAKRTLWDEELPRHQDWDWLDRLERSGARITQLTDASAVIWTGSDGSISSSSDWRSSLAWAETRRGLWEPEVLVDFLVGQPLRYALQSRSLEGTRSVLRAIIKCRRVPSPPTVMLGLGGLVPRSMINRLLAK